MQEVCRTATSVAAARASTSKATWQPPPLPPAPGQAGFQGIGHRVIWLSSARNATCGLWLFSLTLACLSFELALAFIDPVSGSKRFAEP